MAERGASPEPGWMTVECIEAVARAVRYRRMERTSAGRAHDPTVPPTDNELDDARAALLAAAPYVDRLTVCTWTYGPDGRTAVRATIPAPPAADEEGR